MQPAGLLKNRGDRLAAAAKQTNKISPAEFIYHVNACVHMRMRVELLLIIEENQRYRKSGKKPRRPYENRKENRKVVG